MKKILTLLSLALILNGCVSPKDKKEWMFDFNDDLEGFEEIFADYHDDGNDLETYEMTFGRELIPVGTNASQGLFISAQNRSDDLFMGYFKKLTGLKSSLTYKLKITFKLATKEEAGSIGVGGSPAESVYVKAGAVNQKPEIELDDQQVYRLNVDKGNQSEGSDLVPVVSNMAKPDGSAAGYIIKELSVEVEITTTADGSVYLLIGTDSAFEGLTRYYLDDIKVIATQK